MAKTATNQERLNQLFDADARNDIDIASFLGVSKQTISAWRNGTRSPKRSMITKIAQAYNTTEEWLMGWDLPAHQSPINPNHAMYSFMDCSASSSGDERKKTRDLSPVFFITLSLPAAQPAPAARRSLHRTRRRSARPSSSRHQAPAHRCRCMPASLPRTSERRGSARPWPMLSNYSL